MAEREMTRKKSLGSYYTAPAVVEFLVAWGLDQSPGVVMDPSCGDGRFLAAAALRGATGLIGCDLDGDALESASRMLAAHGDLARVYDSDFFLLDPDEVGPVDLIAGNPPFIRYQRFGGESRARALASALRVGARLTRLTASWAPFLLHAMQFLRPQGAMAMVVPAELAQAQYGVETLRVLCEGFGRVRLIAFRQNWLEDAQQETFLLLAQGRGRRCASAELIPLERIEDLDRLVLTPAHEGISVDAGSRLSLAFLDAEARALLRELSAHPAVVTLGAVGNLSNGYVTGANDFFHCLAAEGPERGLPSEWLLPVARNSRSIVGLSYEMRDITDAERRGVAHHLIRPMSEDLFSISSSAHRDALEAFIDRGDREGISQRYKCRVRHPWWRVPGLIQPDLFLPYMIGTEPHAACNPCRALYPNSLHGIRLSNPALAERLALGLMTSLSLLSFEVEGRSYGGGILKLEPTEMQSVRTVLPCLRESDLGSLFAEVDALLRGGEFRRANGLADRCILGEQLGLPDAAIAKLSESRERLVNRRSARAGARR